MTNETHSRLEAIADELKSMVVSGHITDFIFGAVDRPAFDSDEYDTVMAGRGQPLILDGLCAQITKQNIR